MKAAQHRRNGIRREILQKAQAKIVRLLPEQAQRLERYRDYLERRWNRPVSPAEAFVDVVSLKADRRRIRN